MHASCHAARTSRCKPRLSAGAVHQLQVATAAARQSLERLRGQGRGAASSRDTHARVTAVERVPARLRRSSRVQTDPAHGGVDSAVVGRPP